MWLVAIYVKEGTPVKKGQVLAELDTEALKKALVGAKAEYDYAVEMYNRVKNLWDKKIGTESQYLEAKMAKEGLEQKYLGTLEQIEMAKFKSPINGTVEEIPFKVGQAVSPGVNPDHQSG